MSYILNIDSCNEIAHVSLSEKGKLISTISNAIQKDHAAFIHPAIQQIVTNTGFQLQKLDGIAVTAGPGSYTGIRVGMASAKGLCVALGKPLILINSLEMMAKDAILQFADNNDYLFCPMIDARRMEIYTAVYNNKLDEIIKPAAMIISDNSFTEIPMDSTIVHVGSGCEKWKHVVKYPNHIFIQNVNLPQAMAILSTEKYTRKSFTDLIYSDPLYLKEFYNPTT